jgi:regulator of G-protein signaling
MQQHMACSVGGGRISPVGEADHSEHLQREIDSLRIRLEHRIGGVKLSKVAESYCTFYEQWAEYDAFITLPEPSNPWVTDSTDFWELERQTKDVPCRRVRRWAFSVKELLRDPAGREQFFKFLEKEFSAENLK